MLVAGQPQDGDDQVAQAGHDPGAVGGANLRTVFIEVEVTQCRRSSIPQWPRMMAASWAWVAWVTFSEVAA